MSESTEEMQDKLKKHYKKMLSEEVVHYLQMSKMYHKTKYNRRYVTQSLCRYTKSEINASKKQIIQLVNMLKAYK